MIVTMTAPTTTKNLAERARAVTPGGVNSGQRQIPGLEDLVVTGTSGATFTDDRGTTYTDYHAAFGAILLGHNDPDVDAAVAHSLGEREPDKRVRYIESLKLVAVPQGAQHLRRDDHIFQCHGEPEISCARCLVERRNAYFHGAEQVVVRVIRKLSMDLH